MWECPNCYKLLLNDEVCSCGCALEIKKEYNNDYELVEILEQIEELTKKAQKLIKNK